MTISMASKRSHPDSTDAMDLNLPSSKPDLEPTNPFLPMFNAFRTELDAHHDRRERVIKASRDITALSKKIIFALQRSSTSTANIHEDSPQHAQISSLYASVLPDLQGLNAHRYAPQISGANQEFVEALLFEHFLRTITINPPDSGRSLSNVDDDSEFSDVITDVESATHRQQSRNRHQFAGNKNAECSLLLSHPATQARLAHSSLRHQPPTRKGINATASTTRQPNKHLHDPQRHQHNEPDIPQQHQQHKEQDTSPLAPHVPPQPKPTHRSGNRRTAAPTPAVAPITTENGSDDARVETLSPIDLTEADYLLGLYDMTGELMRYGITATSTSTTPSSSADSGAASAATTPPNVALTVLQTLRATRTHLSGLWIQPGLPLARNVEKKREVMEQSVEKVERAVYSSVVRRGEKIVSVGPAVGA